MNAFKVVVSLAVLLASPVSQAVQNDQPGESFVIGLSPYLERNVKDQVYRQVIALVVEGLPQGSKLHVYDAYNLQTITELSIPNLAPAPVFGFRAGRASRAAGPGSSDATRRWQPALF